MYSIKSFLCILGLSYFSTCIAQNEDFGIINDDQCGILHNLPNGEIKFPWVATVYTINDTVAHMPAAILTPSLVIMNANYYFKELGKLVLHNFSKYLVSANLTRLNETNKDNPFIQTVKITHIRLHPKIVVGIDWPFFDNDYALIHLETPIRFDNQVHAMCFPTTEIVENIQTLWSSDTITTENPSILVSGWSRNTTDYNYHNLTLNREGTCKNWWNFDFRNETEGAPYINRFCANVSSGDAHVYCINRDTAVVGRVNTLGYYFLGLVNNFFSDNKICNDKTRVFVSKVIDFNLDFIRKSIRCGPTRFTCDSGQCVSVESICNGKNNCYDGSDENDLYCNAIHKEHHKII